MSKYTVRKTTKGLGEYLLSVYREEVRHQSVAIGCDTKTYSRLFAYIVAAVLSGMGIRVYLHSDAVRHCS